MWTGKRILSHVLPEMEMEAGRLANEGEGERRTSPFGWTHRRMDGASGA